MSHIKKYFLLGVAIVVILFIFVFSTKNKDTEHISRNLSTYEHTEVKIGTATFTTAISDTDVLRSTGLSGITELKTDEGMLFMFEKEALWGFWMKDMKFSIDIVWLNKEKKVISFEKNVSPATFPKTFFPKGESLYALEFKEGTLEKLKVNPGDIFIFTQK